MNRLRQCARLLATLQLLPALESGEETVLVGGQAVLEGVMMRSPHAYSIAVRRPTGEIACHTEPLDRPSDRRRWLGWPLVRGLATLGQAMALGVRALRYSANVALEEEAKAQNEKKIEISGWVMAANLALSLGFFIFLYKFVPLLAATEMKKVAPAFGNHFLFNLVDGSVRILLFLSFLFLISRWKDIRRVFEFHGAEHKTVFAFEDGKELLTPNVQAYSTFHPRCGTSFLMTVMLLAIAMYTLVPVSGFWPSFAVRVALLPVIAAISYEIIRYAARHRGSLFALMTAPGLWLQRITTQPPADHQVECAVRALENAMALERERGGELVIA